MTDKSAVRDLFVELLTAWNEQNADQYAACFAENASVVGFDGSQMDGRTAIAAEIGRIFKDHRTARYVWIVREIRFLTPQTALLRAVAGMVPPGESDLKPERNAIQSMVASKSGDLWEIALFQNTPARFDGRPELSQQLTEELRGQL